MTPAHLDPALAGQQAGLFSLSLSFTSFIKEIP